MEGGRRATLSVTRLLAVVPTDDDLLRIHTKRRCAVELRTSSSASRTLFALVELRGFEPLTS